MNIQSDDKGFKITFPQTFVLVFVLILGGMYITGGKIEIGPICFPVDKCTKPPVTPAASNSLNQTSSSDNTLVAIQATQTKLAQLSISPTFTPTQDNSVAGTLVAIGATQTAMAKHQTTAPLVALPDLSPSDTSSPSSDSASSADSQCPTEAMMSNLLPPTAVEGTGVFAKVSKPNGRVKLDVIYYYDAANKYPCVQFMSPGTIFDTSQNQDCLTSSYHTNRIWFGSILRGTAISVSKNGSNQSNVIGVMNTPSQDTRSYLLDYELNLGDQICIVAPKNKTMKNIIDAGGYRLGFGSDLMKYADSWCNILETDGSKHYCN